MVVWRSHPPLKNVCDKWVRSTGSPRSSEAVVCDGKGDWELHRGCILYPFDVSVCLRCMTVSAIPLSSLVALVSGLTFTPRWCARLKRQVHRSWRGVGSGASEPHTQGVEAQECQGQPRSVVRPCVASSSRGSVCLRCTKSKWLGGGGDRLCSWQFFFIKDWGTVKEII